MGYQQVKLFVKISSTFPYNKINDYFVGYLNNLQKDTEEFIIGDLFNSRENELWAIFSDKTRDSHSMPSNSIPILQASVIDEKFNSLSESVSGVNISDSDLQIIQPQVIKQIIDKISLQQIFNEVTSKVYNDVMKQEDSIINNVAHMVSRYLITEGKIKI